MKKFTKVLIMFLLLIGVSLNAQDMVISGVIDGPLSGGIPKAIEVYVVNDIADASIYGLGSANNGGGSDGQEFTFPAESFSSGDYILVASEDVAFADFFGFAPDYVSDVSNINGDDAIELFMNDNVVDVFGDINVDGSGEPWEYLDGWAYRVDGTGPDGSTFVLNNFTYSGPNALDGETSNDDAAIPFPIKTYTAEASSTVATPVISPNSGDYFDPIDVSMTCSTAGATIYYTTDGSDPDESSTTYSGSFVVNTTTTVKARAYESSMTESNIATKTYTFPTYTEVSTIAILRTQTVGDYFILTGEAVLTFKQSYRNQKFVQDATSAILVDDDAGEITSTYNLYDGITGISGQLTEYGGMLQFVPSADPGSASSTSNTVTPEVVSFSQLNNNFEDYEAKLVKVENVTFVDGGSTFAVGTEYVMTDNASLNYVFRTSFYNVDYIDSTVPTEAQDLVLIAHSRTDGEFVASRSLADFTEATGGSDAVQLDITSINDGNDVYEGQAFSISVQAQDENGDEANVDADVNVTLTVGTGTGTLGGTVTGTITSGNSSVTISGVTYSPFESSVVLNVSDNASNLTSGNSDAFDVIEVVSLDPPTNLQAVVGSENDVQLTWDAPAAKAEVLGYNVYRDDMQINAGLVELTNYNDPEPSIASHDYYVTAVYDGGESDPSNVVTVVITGIHDISDVSVAIYPNPTNSVFTIAIGEDMIMDVSILDVTGKLIYNSTINTTSQVNVSDFQKGIYLVHLLDKSTNNLLIKKLIVK